MKFKGSIVIGDPSYFMKSDEDWQKSVNPSGWICSDSRILCGWILRKMPIIPDFDGEVSSEEVEDNEDDTYLSVYGTGNINFRSKHVPKKELYALHNS